MIVGGGTSGAALAGILARDTDASILLLEAGPDYGAFGDGGWPAELLDARHVAVARDSWGYAGLAHPSHVTPIAFDRARVIGGCSAHNGCVALAGHRRDYDAWAELGNPGWDWASVAPAFERARTALRVRQVDPDEATPFHAAFADACETAGLARQANLDNPDGVAEIGFSPVNIRDGVRWNAAFAYLDPVRTRANLQIVGDVLVDRVEVADGRAIAVHVIRAGIASRIEAACIVLCGGAYGSPAVLLRSGIGPPDPLLALGIRAIHPLAGVGHGLQDHPSASLSVSGTPQLDETMRDFGTHWLPDEQALAKARSHLCREAFDLHLFSYGPPAADGSERSYQVWVACLTPESSGSLTLASADPATPPRIDHGFLSDPAGHDRAVLEDGLELAREITSGGALGQPVIEADWLPRLGHYFHPACTCRMGPASDPLAVVNSDGAVHGLQGLYVCDASIFPRLMRANTNLPAAMLAEHLATAIATGQPFS